MRLAGSNRLQEKVYNALRGAGVQLETDGGDIPVVEISAKAGTGMSNLIETLATTAEIREIRAESDGRAHGVVIESRLDKGFGNLATVLVKRGTLKVGASVVAGTTWARVRAMQSEQGKIIKKVSPGFAVTIAGWKELPAAGSEVLEADSESDAQRAIVNRKKASDESQMMQDLEAINESRQSDREQADLAQRQASISSRSGLPLTRDGQHSEVSKSEPAVKELRLVIKCDVHGTADALVGVLEPIGNQEAKVHILRSGVGSITEADVSLAQAAEGKVSLS